MEIEQEYNTNNNNYKLDPNSNANTFYYNENVLFNNNKNFNFPFLSRNKYVKKRNYNESLNPSQKILIREKELKYLLNILNQIREKVDSNNNFKDKTDKTNEAKEPIKNNKDIKIENSKNDFRLDYSMIDLNELIFHLYQSNNISIELKKFVLKKLVDNAIKVERTFQNYFNLNNMPNKK